MVFISSMSWWNLQIACTIMVSTLSGLNFSLYRERLKYKNPRIECLVKCHYVNQSCVIPQFFEMPHLGSVSAKFPTDPPKIGWGSSGHSDWRGPPAPIKMALPSPHLRITYYKKICWAILTKICHIIVKSKESWLIEI